jgi:hypothetical protein
MRFPRRRSARPLVPALLTITCLLTVVSSCNDEFSAPQVDIPERADLGRGLTADVVGTSTLSLVDGLGVATPATQFNVGGSGGTAIVSAQFAGPRFILNQPTRITEIGGFLNCAQCPGIPPFIVQIRPSRNGIPDATTVLASFVLSDDDDPRVISYESVAPNLTLGPGSYFAIFAPQGGAEGFVLGRAQSPFLYVAGPITEGFINPSTGISSAHASRGAVRVLGTLVITPQAAIQLLMIDVRTLVLEGELAKGPGNGLLNKLRTATASLGRGRTKTGCNQLRAFVNQVHALVRSGRLPTEAGQELVEAGEGVRTQIECL